MKPIKLKNHKYQNLWEELQEIFLNDYKGVDNRIKRELKKLGFEVYGNYHPKIKVLNKVVVLTSTSSTRQTGRTILRLIRRILEENKQ